MGRQAKLKQLRHQKQEQEQSQASTKSPYFDQTQFVQQLKREGYQLEQAEHSPDVPLPKQSKPTNPQL